MRKEEQVYYEDEKSSFKMDLHNGKIKIYEVPFEYRTRSAYMFAHESTLAIYDGSENAKMKKLELKLLKHQLEDDIMENERRGFHNKAESLRDFYVNWLEDFRLTDSQGRWYNYEGGYDKNSTESEGE